MGEGQGEGVWQQLQPDNIPKYRTSPFTNSNSIQKSIDSLTCENGISSTNYIINQTDSVSYNMSDASLFTN